MAQIALWAVFAVGLAIATLKAEDWFLRIFFALACLLNVVGVITALGDHHFDRFQQWESSQPDEPDYHMD
jgi:succinate-acetate transporter protein